MSEKNVYDVVIVGAGAAGLTAAIYTRRKLLKTLVVSIDMGGQNLLTEQEENYPGYIEKSGPKLMQVMYEQAISFGAEFVFGRVTKLEKMKNGLFKLTLGNNEQYVGKTVILAHGKAAKKLGIPGEDKFIGRGISTCATCMPPSSLIVVNNSAKPISEVNKDTFVLTHDGSFRRVLDVTSRDYSGPLVKIRTRIFKEQDLYLTPEHPVLVRTLKKGTFGKGYWNFDWSEPFWIAAKDLTKEHLMLYPIVRKVRDIEKIDLQKIIYRNKTEVEEKFIWPKNKTFTTKKLPKTLTIDKEFLRLVGYFVSDGCITDRGINLSFNASKEKKYANDVKRIIKKKFGLDAYIKIENGVARVEIYSILIRYIFERLFGKYSYNKQLPHAFLYLPLEKQAELIKGVWRGDGCLREKDFVINSNSLKLIEQIKNILLRFDIILGISKISLKKLRNYISVIDGRKIEFKHDKYQISVGGPSLQKMAEILSVRHPKIKNRKGITHHAWIKGNFVALPLRDIEIKKYIGKVLNVATENNTYVTPNGIVHNCDAPLYRGKTVAILGGGNSALEAAELLTKFATKVYLIHRRDSFRADEVTVEKVRKAKNVEMILNSTVVEILGKEKFEGAVVEDLNTKKKTKLKLDGLFLEIGHVLDTEWVKDFVDRNQLGEIITGKSAETKTEGVFAAGDVTNGMFKQTVTAAGEGAVAGLGAYNWLMKKEGKAAIKADWS